MNFSRESEFKKKKNCFFLLPKYKNINRSGESYHHLHLKKSEINASFFGECLRRCLTFSLNKLSFKTDTFQISYLHIEAKCNAQHTKTAFISKIFHWNCRSHWDLSTVVCIRNLTAEREIWQQKRKIAIFSFFG